MSDETFASAVMKKLRELEAEQARQPRFTITSATIAPYQPRPPYNAERRRFELPTHLVLRHPIKPTLHLSGPLQLSPELRRMMGLPEGQP